MAETLKSQVGETNGCDYFEKLPDEVVVSIFIKLSNSSGNNTLEEDIRSLVQCSAVSRRFNALNSLVPTLSVSHPSIKLLTKCCPKILNKFKHIRSLHVNHSSSTETESYNNELQSPPFILWGAVYEPRNYCLVVVSSSHIAEYVPKASNPEIRTSSIHFNVSDHVEYKLCETNRADTEDMFVFHHKLLSSIREHKMLQRIVVANSRHPELGSLTVEGHMLAKLKNCASTNLEQVQFRDSTGGADILDIQLNQNKGFVMSNIYFDIIQWWEKSTDQINKNDDDSFDGYHSIPKALHLKGSTGVLLKKVLKSLLVKCSYSFLTADHRITNKLLSNLK